MTRRQRQGAVLMFVGLALPLVLLPFVSVWADSRHAPSTLEIIQQGTIILSSRLETDEEHRRLCDTQYPDAIKQPLTGGQFELWRDCYHNTYRSEIAVSMLPYRWVCAAGIVLLFMGGGMFVLGARYSNGGAGPSAPSLRTRSRRPSSPGSGLIMAGAIVTLAGLCIVLVRVFNVPDYGVLVVVGIGLFGLALIRRLTRKDRGGGPDRDAEGQNQ